jgi:hypothetical protein
MVLKFTKKNLFEQYAYSLRRQKIPSEQLEAAHLEIFAKFSHTHNYTLPRQNDLEILKIKGFFKTVCTFIIETHELEDYKMIDDKTDIIALSIEHTPLTPKMVNVLCQMVKRPRYSWWLKERVQEILSNNISFRESFEKIALENSLEIPQMFR